MEMNQRSSPKGVREKTFRAVALGPANFTVIHRSSTSPLQRRRPLPNSAKLTPPHLPKTARGADEEGEAAIPINFDYSGGRAQDNSKYASFDDFILQTKSRIMSDEDDWEEVAVEFGKTHRFSD